MIVLAPADLYPPLAEEWVPELAEGVLKENCG